MSGTTDVPRLRDQAKTLAGLVQETLADPSKRQAVMKDSSSYFKALAAMAQENLSDTEKRNALLEHAKSLATAAQTHIKDPEKRASLMAMAQSASAVAYETIKDPVKRQELHDTLAATTHKLLTEMHATPAAAPAAEAVKKA